MGGVLVLQISNFHPIINEILNDTQKGKERARVAEVVYADSCQDSGS